MYSIESTLRISYGKTDQMGYVFFGNYPEFYDIGRTELLRSLGVEPARLEKQGILLPVREMNITYLGPVFYDEQIFVETLLKEIGPLKLKFGFRVYNSDRRLINKGDLTFIFVDKKTRKPRRSMDIVNIINKQIYHEVQQ